MKTHTLKKYPAIRDSVWLWKPDRLRGRTKGDNSTGKTSGHFVPWRIHSVLLFPIYP